MIPGPWNMPPFSRSPRFHTTHSFVEKVGNRRRVSPLRVPNASEVQDLVLELRTRSPNQKDSEERVERRRRTEKDVGGECPVCQTWSVKCLHRCELGVVGR